MQGLSTALLWLTGGLLVYNGLQAVVYQTFNPAGVSGQPELDFTDPGRLLAFFALVLVGGAVALAQLIVGLIWMYRASDNVTRRGIRERTWGPGWAVGAWFIPVANLILGWFVIREIWQGSQPDATQADWKSYPMPTWIVVWWSLYVASQLVSYGASIYSFIASFRSAFTNEVASATPPDVLIPTLISAAFYIGAGVLFMRFVRTIQSYQDDLAAGDPLVS